MYKVILLPIFHILLYFYMINSYFGYLNENLKEVKKLNFQVVLEYIN